MKLQNLLLYLILFIFFPLAFSYSQVVWKTDGSIIGPNGEIKRQSYGSMFQDQLKKPTIEWPKASLYGDNPKNYFGNNIFIPGTPLLRMSSIDLGSDYLTKLSKLNNFDNIFDLQKYIIGNANNSFLKELKISEDDAIIFLASKLDLLKENIKDTNLKKVVDKKIINQISNFDKKIDNELSEELENNIEDQIQDQLSEELENNIEDQIQDQIYEGLNDYFDRLEEEYKAKGWVVCNRTENSIMASSSSDGCN